MITGNKTYSDLPAPAYVDVINHIDGTNEDIISVLEKNYRPSAAQAKQFAKRFKGSSRKETAFNVWKFLKDHVRYQADGKRQKIKYISRLLADGVGDCKSFTLAEASILKHFMPIGFRYVSYGNSRTPSHVYMIAKDEIGNTFPVDAVWNEFGTEKNFNHKIDNWMTVESLTGIESVFSQDEIRIIRNRIQRILNRRNEFAKGSATWQKLTDHARKLYTALQNDDISILKSIDGIQDRAARQARRAQRKADGKPSGVKRIALSPGRAAFLELVKLNARGLASKLSKTDPAKVKAKWLKLGGKPEILLAAIAKGKNKKPLLGESKKNKTVNVNGIGVITLAAALIAAAPVLVAVASLLPKGTDASGLDANDIINEAAEAGGDTSFDPSGNEVDIIDKGKGADQGGFLADIPTPVKIIGGVGIVYLAYKAISKK